MPATPSRRRTAARRAATFLTVWMFLLAAAAIAPTATAGGKPSHAGLSNHAPVVTEVTLPQNVQPQAGSTADVQTAISVSDANGCADVASVEVTVLKPDNSTVHRATAAATEASCSGSNGKWSYTFQMDYFDAPATGDDTYFVRVTATDSLGASGTSKGKFHYDELAALGLDRSTFEFGDDLATGSSSDVVDLGVENLGNVRIDADLNGTDLDHESEDASIPVESVHYSHLADMSDDRSLTHTPTTNATFDLDPGQSSVKSLFWQLHVPSAEDRYLPAGDYRGTITVGAVKG